VAVDTGEKRARGGADEPITLPRLPDVRDTPDQPPVEIQVRGDSAQEALPAHSLSAPPSAVRAGGHVLRREEAARALGFARAVTLLAAPGALVAWMLPAEAWLHVAATAALVALAAASAWVWRVASDPLHYTEGVARAYAVVASATILLVIYFLGVFSPAPMLVLLGTAFFGKSDDPRVAFGSAAVVAGAYAALAALVAYGALPDAGVIHALDAPAAVRVPAIVGVPLVMLAALWQARVSRAAMLDALARSNDAVRASMKREAELDNVNKDIDYLLRVGVKRAGPYSGVRCGKFVLGDLIGRGAMGEVYSGKTDDTKQVAAVKLLQPSMLADQHLVLRFSREAEAASKLVGPNVVSIYEVGKTDDGAPYIAMELLRGHDLAWHLQHRVRLSLDEVLGIVEQVGRGLEAARLAGIVHRDLKPQNLFLAQQPGAAPLWKILDFGVSRLIGSGGTLTQEGIVGTPGYMSPEQAAGREATHRSDVFSFGVVVYRALTGEAPFSGPDTPQILYQVVYRCPTRPGELAAGLPPDVDLALAIALAKDQEDRFASALDFSAALAAAAKNQLDPALRLHAQTLLAALPWGRSARESGMDSEG
jgi:serine/threonine-protein kinase